MMPAAVHLPCPVPVTALTTTTAAKAPLLPELLLLGLLALLWGSSYLLIRVALTDLPPVTLIALRVSLATLLLLAAVRWQGHRLPRDGATWRRLFVQSLLNATAAWTLLAWGRSEEHTAELQSLISI